MVKKVNIKLSLSFTFVQMPRKMLSGGSLGVLCKSGHLKVLGELQENCDLRIVTKIKREIRLKQRAI